MSVVVVEPHVDGFVDATYALVEQLCVDAQHDSRSPRYFFGFAAPNVVERVRALLVAMKHVTWDAGDDRIRVPSGQVVVAGAQAIHGWPFARAVVVCSGDYPDRDTLATVRDSGTVVLVLDPHCPPTRADELRGLDDDR